MSDSDDDRSGALREAWPGQVWSAVLHGLVVAVASRFVEPPLRRYWFFGLGISAAWAVINAVGLATGRRVAAGSAVVRGGAAITVGLIFAVQVLATDRNIGDGMGGALALLILAAAAAWAPPIILEALVVRGVLRAVRESRNG